MNMIHEVTDPLGTRLTDTEDIKAEAVRFFSDLLTKEPADYVGCFVAFLQELLIFRCSDQQRSQLVSVVTEAEIKQIIFSMPMNKSLGPDGYTVEFFKAALPLIGKDL